MLPIPEDCQTDRNHRKSRPRRLSSAVLLVAGPAFLMGACERPPDVPTPDVSGKWILTMDPDFRGSPSVSDCWILQDYNKLGVQCAGGEEMGGDVKGTKIEWWLSPPLGEKYPAGRWIGTVDPSGGSIQGTWNLAVVGDDLRGNFSATRKRPARSPVKESP